MKGLKKSVEELDPSFVMDGVARGTGSLARHTVGGIADSASLLTETFSKNMAVLTLDRRYAQRRDRAVQLRATERGTTTFVEGVESGVIKLLRGVVEGDFKCATILFFPLDFSVSDVYFSTIFLIFLSLYIK